MVLQEVQGKVKDIASALAAIGIAAQGRAAVFSVNCPEWMMVLQVRVMDAILRVSASLHCLLSKEEHFVENHTWRALIAIRSTSRCAPILK